MTLLTSLALLSTAAQDQAADGWMPILKALRTQEGQGRDLERENRLLRERVRVLETRLILAPQKPLPHLAWVDAKAPQGKVTAVAPEIGLTVISLGREDGIQPGNVVTIHRGIGPPREMIAQGIVDRADRHWSAVRIRNSKGDVRVADTVFVGKPVTEAERRKMLAFLFTFRPITAKDREAVMKLLPRLTSASIEQREEAVRGIVRLGGPAHAVLRSIDRKNLDSETRARLEEVDRKFAELGGTDSPDSLERNLTILAAIEDPRAYERLKRILSQAPPFSTTGFPERRAGLEAYLKGWWAFYGESVRWNVVLDCYEAREK